MERREGIGPCWVWPGCDDDEYGSLKLNGKTFKAHRLSYYVFKGNIPNPSLLVCHKCDYPPCVNPAHLFLGTHLDNMQDAKIKGRETGKQFKKGEEAPDAKLTWDQVREIRKRYREKRTTHEALARIFGVSRSAITQILRNATWREPN